MAVYKHFGINIRSGKYESKMTRENYAIIDKKCTTHRRFKDYFKTYWGEEKRHEFLKIYEDESATTYTDSWCKKHQDRALENFDLNIKYFDSLNRDEFSKATNNFLDHNSEFIEIEDLNEAAGMSGYYVLVIGEYCQIYIGTSNNIKRRVMQHWSNRKQFDTLIFGQVETSKLSIDSFRALDTTRIFVYYTDAIYSIEDDYINSIPDKFCCNRTGGGLPEFGVVSILASSKYRELDK